MCWVNVLWKTYRFNKWHILLGQIKGITGRELAKKMFQYHEQCIKWLYNNTVIAEECDPYFTACGKLHWDLIAAVVMSFSEMLTFYLRKKIKGRTLTSITCHSSPANVTFTGAIPIDAAAAFPMDTSARCGRDGGSHCPWQCVQQGQQEWLRLHLLMAPSALGCLKKGVVLRLSVSSYTVTLNSNYAYLSSIPKCRIWNCILMGKNWWQIAVLKSIVLAGFFKSVMCQSRRYCIK